MSHSTAPRPSLTLPKPEFVALIASLMALNAFAMDIMVPAMAAIREDLGAASPNDAQLMIIVYMIGFAVSQLFYGALSDAWGRKRLLYYVLAAYAFFSLGCAFANNFDTMLALRFCLGLAAGGTRVIAVSVVRDLFSGRTMASLMSVVITVFMIVPVLAPSVGQLVLFVAPWPGLFIVLAAAGAGLFVWSHFRLPETLPADARRPLNLGSVLGAYREVMSHRVVVGYAIASGLTFGAVVAFISTAEQVFRETFDRSEGPALYFALIASGLAVGTLTNSRIVEKVGMRILSHGATCAFTVISATLWGLSAIFGQHLVLYLVMMPVAFCCLGFIAGNFNAIAMEPVGNIAGTAAAVLGCSTTLMSAVIGGVIGSRFDGTIYPLMAGFTIMGLLTVVVVFFTEGGRLFNSR